MSPPPDNHADYHAAAKAVERLGFAVLALAVAVIISAALSAF